MAQSFVQAVQQSLLIEDADDVSASAIEQDEETGKYHRVFRYFGTGANGEAGSLVLTVRVVAATRQALELTTQPLQV